MTEPYLFISHSSRDSVATGWLAARLHDAGFNVWVDVEAISPGASWPRAIQQAVEGCGALIVVLTSSSRDSQWVERETLLAFDRHKPVFIALFEDVPLPLHLLNLQYSDFRGKRERALGRLIGALRKVSLTEPLPPPTPTEQKRRSPDPNKHNLFRFIEQLPDGELCAHIARDLFAWSNDNADNVTFSGRGNPAFHAHVYLGPGGVAFMTVRAYPKQPAVEVPLQYLMEFAPYDERAEREAVLMRFNALMPPRERFDIDRANKRPNLPIAAALAVDGHLDTFKSIMTEVLERMRRAAE
jgi:hypothetical protein